MVVANVTVGYYNPIFTDGFGEKNLNRITSPVIY